MSTQSRWARVHSARRAAFTLIEILVVVSIISILMSLLMPAIQAARASARSAICKSHLQEMGIAYKNFGADARRNNRVMPTTWTGQLAPHLQAVDAMYKCPEGVGQTGTPLPYVILYKSPSTTGITVSSAPGALCQRTDGGTGVYTLKFDGGTALDFSALWLQCTTNSDNTVKFSVTKADPSYRAEIYDVDGTMTVGTNGASGNFKASIPADYGMNARAFKFTGETGKVLILDYTNTLADVVGAGATQIFQNYVAARHGGTCNVLFYDGSVDSRIPDDIDAAIPELHDRFWKPTLDPPLASP